MAERVGFEPTYRLITDNSISSRARYGLFATFPQGQYMYLKNERAASVFSGLPEHGAAGVHVEPELGAERIEGLKAALPAQFPEEAHFQFLSVEV